MTMTQTVSVPSDEQLNEDDITLCEECREPGIRLEGFPFAEPLYECTECEEVWHVVASERRPWFPEPRVTDDLETTIREFNRIYPPVEPEDLASLLPLSVRLEVLDDMELEAWAESVQHPAFLDERGHLLCVAYEPYRALLDTARERFGPTPTRFSLLARVLGLEGALRNGSLSRWGMPPAGAGDGESRIPAAVVEVYARTPAHQLEDRTLARLIGQVTRQMTQREVDDGSTA